MTVDHEQAPQSFPIPSPAMFGQPANMVATPVEALPDAAPMDPRAIETLISLHSNGGRLHISRLTKDIYGARQLDTAEFETYRAVLSTLIEQGEIVKLRLGSYALSSYAAEHPDVKIVTESSEPPASPLLDLSVSRFQPRRR